jgi:hypothetical protein
VRDIEYSLFNSISAFLVQWDALDMEINDFPTKEQQKE